MSETIEDFDEGESALPPASLERLIELGREMLEAKSTVDELSELLKSANDRLNQIKTKVLPDAMAELGLPLFQVEKDGERYQIEVSDFVSGSLPKEQPARQKAIDWLTEHGGESLLKTEVSLEFGKSQHNEAVNIIESLKQQGYMPLVNFGVHSATLCAFAKEMIKSGEEIDTTTLGLYVGRTAKIKEVKEKVTRKRAK